MSSDSKRGNCPSIGFMQFSRSWPGLF
jgi:hypothetical protein